MTSNIWFSWVPSQDDQKFSYAATVHRQSSHRVLTESLRGNKLSDTMVSDKVSLHIRIIRRLLPPSFNKLCEFVIRIIHNRMDKLNVLLII